MRLSESLAPSEMCLRFGAEATRLRSYKPREVQLKSITYSVKRVQSNSDAYLHDARIGKTRAALCT